MTAVVDGTSGVNADGRVVVFVPREEWAEFDDFVMEGASVSLRCDTGTTFRRTYGALTVETLRRRGSLLAVETGLDASAGRTREIGIRRGR